MAKTYSCPKCGHDVPLKDINVSKDILLCASCGEVSLFSDVVGTIEADAEDDQARALLSGPPPKHLKVENDPADPSGRLVLTHRKISAAAVFLVPFTAVWSGMSMYVIYVRQIIEGKFELQASLFGLPFLLGTIVLVSVCLFLLFGRRVLTLARGEGTYFVGVGPVGKTRRFSYDRNTRVSLGVSLYQVNHRPLPQLVLTNPAAASKTTLFAGLDETELSYVRAILNREIART